MIGLRVYSFSLLSFSSFFSFLHEMRDTRLHTRVGHKKSWSTKLISYSIFLIYIYIYMYISSVGAVRDGSRQASGGGTHDHGVDQWRQTLRMIRYSF